MQDTANVGSALREMREKSGLKIAAFAHEVDLASAYIYQVEGNVLMPSKDYLLNLIRIYRSRSDENTEDKAVRIHKLVGMIKDKFVEININKIYRKAQSKYGDLYNKKDDETTDRNDSIPRC